jgi:hypothetical protein
VIFPTEEPGGGAMRPSAHSQLRDQISAFHKLTVSSFPKYHSPVPLRSRGVPVSSPARSGMRRTRRVCGPFVRGARRWRAICEVVKGRRPADGVGGPRTQQCGDAKHSVKAPGARRRWELQADKTAVCGTQAETCFRGPVLLIRSSAMG